MLNGYFAWTSSNCRKHPTIKISLEKIYYILLYRYNSDELFSTERTPTLLFLIISRQEKYKDFKYRIQLNGENGARLPPFHIYISKSNISPLFFALEYLLKKKIYMSRIISISLMHLYSISLTKQKRHSHPFIDFTLPLLLTT